MHLLLINAIVLLNNGKPSYTQACICLIDMHIVLIKTCMSFLYQNALKPLGARGNCRRSAATAHV